MKIRYLRSLINLLCFSIVTMLVITQISQAAEIDDCVTEDCVRAHVVGNGNTYIGIDVATGDQGGRENTFLGYNAAKEYTGLCSARGTGYCNGSTFIGWQAGYTSHNNHATFIGKKAGYNASGQSVGNTFVGALTATLGDPGPYNTAIGFLAGESLAGSSSTANTFLGNESGKDVTSGFSNIAIGSNAGSGHERTGAYYSIETGNFNIHIGDNTESANSGLSSTIVLGTYARAEGSHQMVIGSGQFYTQCDPGNPYPTNCVEVKQCDSGKVCYQYSDGLYTESYWGSGVTSVDPQPFSFNASGGRGSNAVGADLIMAGGRSTGSADGGSIRFQTSPAGTSGSVQNSLIDRMVIGADGNITIGDGSSQSASSLIFHGQSGDCDLTYDSDNGWMKLPCWVSAGGFNFGSGQLSISKIDSQKMKIFARDTLEIDTGIGSEIGTISITSSNIHVPDGSVGIGLTNPQSKLAVSGLPTTPPDSSGNRGGLCVTNNGNIWVDTTLPYDCQ